MDNNYVVYHLHTDLSNGITNIDSITKYQDYVDYAASLGMKAMAFSEHGSVFQWLKKKEAIEKAGMKYIHAEEFYVTESLGEKIRDNYHCVLIAKNYDGFLELNKLSSISFNRDDNHFYYAPRISYDELINTSDNIIICTACLASILASDNAPLKERFISFLTENKHRCFLEIQHHNVQEQKDYNDMLWKLSQYTGVPMVTGTDTHALNDEHMDGRRILQRAKKIHFDNEDGWDLSFKTYDELIAAYEKQDTLPMNVVKEAINNTNKIADMVEEFVMDKSYKYPHLWDNPEELLYQKIMQGIMDKGVDKYPNYQEYLDRVEYEMQAYKHNEAIDFMLLMEDIISWCKSQDIPVGYGRGSVNGSIIAWLIGITEMDSIKYGLNFERFMNVERVSLSDIDTDFPPSRIDEVKHYVFNHHGLYCSDIITFNTIADKGAIRDVCRGLYNNDNFYERLNKKWKKAYDDYTKLCENYNGYPMSEDLRKEIEKASGNYLKITEDVLKLFEESEEKAREKYPEVFKYVDLVKGTIVSIGNHPCGMLVVPFPIDDAVGLCTTSTDPFPISQLYMKEVDSLNYVKLDLLKLDTIELINDTCKMAGIPMVLPDTMDIYDDAVWNSMRDDTTSCFQWESNTGQDYIRRLLSDDTIKKYKDEGLNIDKMTLLSIGNSAIRPAGASYRDDLANGVVRKTGSKPIDEFLSNTFGYLVFQCQIIEFLNQYCGFTMGEADIVRRGFAKKTGTDQFIPVIKDGGYLNGNKNHYIDGYIKTMSEKYGISAKKSEEDIVAFIKVIEDASSYLFSLNHSQPYSFMGYACAYLRYYYPTEFITCCLNINKDNSDKTRAVTQYAKKVGVQIVPIKFGYSRASYSCDAKNKLIYKGVESIKNLNETVTEELYTLYHSRAYDNFIDVLVDIMAKTSCNSRQLEILIKLDYFSEFGEINALIAQCILFTKLYTRSKGFKKQMKKSTAIKTGIPLALLSKYSEEYKESKANPEDGTFKGLDSERLLKEYRYDGNIRSVKERIKDQQEYLSYIEYTDPSLPPNYVVVTALNTTYSPTFSAYCLKNGESCQMKVHKTKKPKDTKIVTVFSKAPFENGDIICMDKCEKQPKVRKVNDQWVEIPGEYNWWINQYSLIKI